MSIKKKNIVYNIAIFLSIPIIFFLIFSFINTISYTNSYKSILTSSYSTEFKNFLYSAENSFSDIISAYTTLSSNQDVKNICKPETDQNNINHSELLSAQSALLNFSIQNPQLNDIFLINRSQGFVVDSTGLYNLLDFFNNIYTYSEYDANFWLNYSPKTLKFESLSPTYAQKSKNNKQSVVPVVLPMYNSNISALAVFNVNIDNLYNDLINYTFTENTEFIIYSPKSKIPAFNKPLVLSNSKLLNSSSYFSSHEQTVGGKKYFVLSSHERSNIYGCSYFVKIPYSDMKADINNLSVLVLITLLLYIVYLFYGSKKFSNPWILLSEKLSNFNNTANKTNDIIHNVDTAINELISKNSSLSHNLSVSLSHGKKKYLTDLLNSSDSVPDDNMNKLIFEKDYFISIILKISFKKMIEDSIFTAEQLRKKLYEVIESLFLTKFSTLSLDGTNNSHTMILNTDLPNNDEVLEEIYTQIFSLFSHDAENLDIIIGSGKTYKGIEGLRISHQEATADFFEKIDKNKVRLYNTQNINKYTLNLHYENILTNHLLSGNCKSAAEFISNIFITYSNESDMVKKHIYSDLLKVINKVCLIKNITISDFSELSEHEIIDKLNNLSDNDILTYITNLINNIDSMSSHTATKSSVSEIIDYINKNYSTDLFLEGLAEEFNSTPKYISKILKQHLGLPFKTYLTQLRMNKAEELLRDKSIPLNEISQSIGFTNYSSFVRSFKQKNGISPNEYRRLYTK